MLCFSDSHPVVCAPAQYLPDGADQPAADGGQCWVWHHQVSIEILIGWSNLSKIKSNQIKSNQNLFIVGHIQLLAWSYSPTVLCNNNQ